jgi:hypothetical protein
VGIKTKERKRKTCRQEITRNTRAKGDTFTKKQRKEISRIRGAKTETPAKRERKETEKEGREGEKREPKHCKYHIVKVGDTYK